MSPATSWTELNVDATDWQDGFIYPPSGIVDVMFGAFVLTQPDFIDVVPSWTELSAPSTAGTEFTVPATVWTELT